VYSAIEAGMQEGILGADNGIAKFRAANKNPKISSKETILIREISLGYYGRYKTPLNTMGVIDKNSHIISGIDTVSLYGTVLYHEILSAFEAFLSLKKEERTYKQFKASDELLEAVCGKFRSGEKEFWTGKLQIDGENRIDLMNSCYALVNQDYKGVFDNLRCEKEVDDVEKLEPFLRCMESVFYRALSSRNINDIVIDDPTLRKHKKYFKDFITVSDSGEANSALLDKRLSFIKKECSPEKTEYAKNVIAYHKLVCDQKCSAVWLELDAGGNIQSFVQQDIEIDIDSWGRDYYLASLFSIKTGIEELS
jgi:hypothetical protein